MVCRLLSVVKGLWLFAFSVLLVGYPSLIYQVIGHEKLLYGLICLVGSIFFFWVVADENEVLLNNVVANTLQPKFFGEREAGMEFFSALLTLLSVLHSATGFFYVVFN